MCKNICTGHYAPKADLLCWDIIFFYSLALIPFALYCTLYTPWYLVLWHDVVDVGTNCATTLTVLSAFGIHSPYVASFSSLFFSVRSILLDLCVLCMLCVCIPFISFSCVLFPFFPLVSVIFVAWGWKMWPDSNLFSHFSLCVCYCYSHSNRALKFIRFIHKSTWLMLYVLNLEWNVCCWFWSPVSSSFEIWMLICMVRFHDPFYYCPLFECFGIYFIHIQIQIHIDCYPIISINATILTQLFSFHISRHISSIWLWIVTYI